MATRDSRRSSKARTRQGSSRNRAIFALLLAIVLFGIARSAIATRLDSFTIDEAYHITAGVSYLRLGDYRLNPEHPPLVKLWVAAFLPNRLFQLPPLRQLGDKWDERHFTDKVVYTLNDPDQLQRRARLTMYLLNGILLLGFSLAVWRAFGAKIGPAMAIGALAFLAIDPTVAAHMPVVMTDLPVALLSSTAVLLAWTAFCGGNELDLLFAGITLGLALGTKHSALILPPLIILLGLVMLLRTPKENDLQTRSLRFASILAVLVLAAIVLFGLYRFRYNESPAGIDLFNRPLAAKIDDLHEPVMRESISLMAKAHLLPRAYLWGLADILHVSREGRLDPQFFLRHTYLEGAPWYFFPVALLVKLPIGLLLLASVGKILALLNRSWPGEEPLWIAAGFAGFMLVILMTGTSSYAGIRHALPVFPSIALFAAAAVSIALERKSRILGVFIGLATIVALVSAIPASRPWEYYNEFVGGKDNAWHYFSDEGIDLGQRSKELASYYHQELEPKGELPYIDYAESSDEHVRRGVRTIQQFWKEHPETDKSDTLSGTIMISAAQLYPMPVGDQAQLRAAQPIARFGNLLIFRGTFSFPAARALRLAERALDAEYSEKPNLRLAEELLKKSLELNPGLFARWIDLGNILSQRGAREEALRAYQNALANVPAGNPVLAPLKQQIRRISQEDPKTVPPLRNPSLE